MYHNWSFLFTTTLSSSEYFSHYLIININTRHARAGFASPISETVLSQTKNPPINRAKGKRPSEGRRERPLRKHELVKNSHKLAEMCGMVHVALHPSALQSWPINCNLIICTSSLPSRSCENQGLTLAKKIGGRCRELPGHP